MAEDKKKPHAHGAKDHKGDPSINDGEMAANYGLALAFMNSNHELKHLFDQAVANTWTPAKFTAELQNTKWFKQHSAAVRNATLQKTSDPATWKQSVDKTYSSVKDTLGNLYGTQALSDKQLRKWSEQATMMGWTQQQLVDHLTSSVNYQSLLNKKNLGGTAADTKSQIGQLAAQYALNPGDHWTNANVQNVLAGNTTIGAVQAQLKNLAKQQYTAFADRLDAGETMQQIADPFVTKMADLLEMNPNQINLSDGAIQKALTQKDPKTGKVSPMTLSDFSDYVRSDPRWQYTDNARQAVASVVNNLAQSWGVGV